MKKIVLFILAVSFFTACKKDEYTGDPLLKYRLKEYTCDHYKYTYEYDSLNRIVKSGTYYDEGLVYNTRYFYVNSRLDSLITYNSYYPMTYETFKYIGDTIFQTTFRYSFDEKITLKFVLHDNQIAKILLPPCILGDSSYQCSYEVLHWDNNNLTYKYVYSNSGWIYPYYKGSENSGEFQMTNAIWSAYDEHPNPLKFIYDQVYPDKYESSKNNLLRMVVSDMQGDTLFRIFKHTYNENGLPIATTETQEKNNTILNESILLVSSTSTYKYEEYK
jgi:hypothetical protein